MRYAYLLLTFALLLVSCQKEEERIDTPEGNFEALWTMIDRQYCFLDYKAESIGLDWDSVHTTYRARLHPKMSRLQLFEVLSAMLSELRDGHVNLYTSVDVARNWSWREDYPANFSQELQDRYLGNSSEYHIASGLRYRMLEDNVAYVVVSSFSSPIGEGNLTDMLHLIRFCDGLILDVRNNSGGDLTVATTLARRFTNERRLVGYIAHKSGYGHSDFSEPMAEYLEPYNGLRWQKPVVVLTNRGCYSATNNFVRDIRSCPLVTTLGDQTGGGSGLPFTSELPCGWLVRFSACPCYDAQMKHIEFGIQPDVPCALDSADVARGYDTLIEKARELIKAH